jgi:hypothetical protein
MIPKEIIVEWASKIPYIESRINRIRKRLKKCEKQLKHFEKRLKLAREYKKSIE